MAKIDKHELIAKVKELDGLTSDEKSQIISFIKTKTYGLVWENSTEKSWEQLKDFIPVLVEDKNKAIINDTETQKNPNHILIEGDNLLALTNLCYTHAGKVDVIYIDPPYNTGKEFVYNDKRIDKDDEYRHSQWLSFMKKRLEIAKTLLSPQGVIMISIDDNEQANLKLLCDSIFSESNFVGGLIHQRAKGGGQAKYVVKGHDYILVYGKNKENVSLTKKKVIQQRTYEINGELYIKNDDVIRKQFGKYDKNLGDRRCYYEQLEEYKGLEKKEEIDRLIAKGAYFLEENQEGMHTICKYEKVDDATSKLYSIIKVLSEEGKKDLEKLGIVGFNYPKPVGLVIQLIEAASNKGSIVLDFFAGSGTTLHATINQNANDNGSRQCILVQYPELTFDIDENGEKVAKKESKDAFNAGYLKIPEITYTRSRRVINGYTKPNGESVEGLPNNNLRYFKVGFAPRAKDLRSIEYFAKMSVPLLCIKEDVYKEQTTLGDLECEGFRYFQDGDKQFIVILDTEMIEPITEELAKMDVEGRIPVYVFTTGYYPYTEDFWQVADKVDLYPYPSCIYGACEKVMPQMKDKLIIGEDGNPLADVDLSEEESNMTYEDLSKE